MKLSATSPAALAILPLITNPRTGELRASKPKDGNAAYVWRMVAFSLSTNPQHHCMPVTADFGVAVPADFQTVAPTDWLEAAIDQTEKASLDNYEGNAGFCIKMAGSVRDYHIAYWSKYGRRQYFIKTVLDPIVDEIVNSVPVKEQPGTMRWAHAYGLV